VEDRPVRRASAEDGFTLAELLTAIVVIGIGIFGTMQLFLASLHATSATTARSRAVAVAGHETDLLRALPWPALGFDPVTAPVDPPEGTTVKVDPALAAVLATGPDQVVAGITYRVDRGVVWVAVGDDPQAEKRLLVTVTWRDETGDHVVRQDGLVAPDQSSATTNVEVAPGAPDSVSAAPDPGWPDSRIDLAWSGGSAATWEVEHALDAAFTDPVVDTASLPPGTATFVEPALSPGTTYWFRVRGRSGSTVSAWSTAARASTAGAISGACRIGAVHASPSPATIDLTAGTLAAPVVIEVEAQGTCAGLSIAVAPDGESAVTRAMTPVAGGVWHAAVEADLTPIRWATGIRSADVLDGTGAVLARVSIAICSGSGGCPS
jgi:prepilin-type N-terminal cleavage/methylation domain-containing protein